MKSIKTSKYIQSQSYFFKKIRCFEKTLSANSQRNEGVQNVKCSFFFRIKSLALISRCVLMKCLNNVRLCYTMPFFLATYNAILLRNIRQQDMGRIHQQMKTCVFQLYASFKGKIALQVARKILHRVTQPVDKTENQKKTEIV